MDEFLEPFERLLSAIAAPAALRGFETGHPPDGACTQLEQSGFLDALVPEAVGGAGLALDQVGSLFQALGRRALSLPVAETMIARMLLAEAGRTAPSGLVAFGDAGTRIPQGAWAGHALLDRSDHLALVALVGCEGTGVHGDPARLADHHSATLLEKLPRPAGGLRPLGALVRTAAIAGAASQLVDMTTGYANERVQFGKAIGKQQAIQQQVAMMAEDAIAVRIAAELACAGGFPLNLPTIAAAKSVASEAAPRIANTAHAVHGAIGMSAEYDLQLYTRRLHEWRLADGTESYWNRLLGAQRLASETGSVDWIREHVFAASEAV